MKLSLFLCGQVPPEPPDVWSSGGSGHGGSPRYSPEPSQDQLHTQYPVDMVRDGNDKI